MNGYYYLHTNGSLIWKNTQDERDFDSDFVVRFWSCDSTNRGNAWQIVLEALNLGASNKQIQELAQKWSLTFEDSIEMLKRSPNPTCDMREGLDKFSRLIFNLEPNDYWKRVEEK